MQKKPCRNITFYDWRLLLQDRQRYSPNTTSSAGSLSFSPTMLVPTHTYMPASLFLVLEIISFPPRIWKGQPEEEEGTFYGHIIRQGRSQTRLTHGILGQQPERHGSLLTLGHGKPPIDAAYILVQKVWVFSQESAALMSRGSMHVRKTGLFNYQPWLELELIVNQGLPHWLKLPIIDFCVETQKQRWLNGLKSPPRVDIVCLTYWASK